MSDTTPPVIAAVTISNPTIALGSSDISLSNLGISIIVSDPLSGVYDIRANWVAPSGVVTQYVWLGAAFGVAPSSGTIQNGTFTALNYASSNLTPFQETGTYNLSSIWVKDNAGNSASYSASQLQSMGANLSKSSFVVTSIKAGLPTYSLIAASASVNEGSTAAFTLTTTNVASGTSIPYTLSGISGRDIGGGSTAGTATVNSLGVATILVSIAADSVTEGSETLSVTAQGQTVTTVLNDTSMATGPTFQIAATGSTSNEGDAAVFVVSTNSIKYKEGSQIAYSITGVSTEDLVNNSLVGSATIRSDGAALIYIYLKNDNLTEGVETLTVNSEGYSASILINDTSKGTATYSLSSSSSSVNEGSTNNFTLTTTNVTSGTSVSYTLSGLSAADVSGGLLSGNAVVNSSGVATISVTLLNDNLTEGPETLTLTAGGASASTVVNDTSIAAATYSIIAEGSSGSSYYKVYSSSNPVSWDGARAIAKTTSYGGAAGYLANVTSQTENSFVTSLLPTTYWNGAWIGASDSTTEGTWRWADGPEAGTQITGYFNFAFGSYRDQEDYLTINGGNINPYKGLWDDRNQVIEPLNLFVVEYPNPVPTYVVSINSPSVNEGSTATFTLTTTNLASGSSVPYTLSGIGAADVLGSSLSGNAVVNSSGVATISVTLLNDSLTEGAETLTVTAGSATASTVINDTSKGTPTYSISTASASVDEGSTATFTLTTTNVASGTSVPYTLSGISASDISGRSLSGNAVVNSNGIATISVGILNDSEIEDAETLNITAGGATNSILINAPTYLLSAFSSVSSVGTSVDEDSEITFLMKTTGIPSGFSLNYTMYGTVSASDFKQGIDYGKWTIDSSGSATLIVGLLADSLTEGLESFTFYSGGSVPFKVTINDTSKASTSPSYSVVATNSSFNEGSTATFNLLTTNVTSGTLIPYTLSGSINASDISGGSLSGNTVVNSSGIATISVTLLNDSLTEGAETLLVTAGGASASTFVNDTSKGTATYSLSGSSASVDEGAIATFNLLTTNVAAGTSISYTIGGVGTADITGGLTGTATVGTNGIATIFVAVAADFLNEGAETLTVTAQGKSASMTINDTSKAVGVAAYAMSAASSSVDEGSTATFTLSTTNVTSGTSVPYTLSGISAVDVSGGSLSGNAVVNSSGVATISVTLLNDSLTEGAETLTVTAGGARALTVVNDTSKANVSYALSAGSTSYNEGNTFFFTLTTNNVTSGTSVPYTLSGSINSADISGGALSGNVIVNGGVGYINVSLLNDNLAEDPETLTVTAGSATASTVINDTSKGTPTYSISTTSASVDEGSIAMFTITASNFIGGGLFIPYTISGINSADVSYGALSGVAFVSANGTTSGAATITIPILADLTTEGPETLTVTAQGKSASVVINDTSKTPVVVPVVKGTSAKDSITNLPVSQNIDAGAGTDTLVYNSNSYEVVISKSGASTKLTNPVTGEEDTLTNVERIKFADTAIALDTSGVGGQAYRIYQAAFNRTPDDVGLGYWISGMDSGASLASVASGFVSSDEFKALYGASPTNAQIVTKFYENVLHRAPEFGGYNYWLGMLNSGLSVSNALAAFSESPENVSGVSGAISNGIRYTPYISPTYSMFANATSVNEGGVATFTLRTANVAAGSSIPYALAGISAADVLGDSLSGNAVVNSSGSATISVALLNDSLTEGAETLKVTAGSATASIVVNDTSITLVGTVSGPNTGGGGVGAGVGGGGGGGG